VQLYDNTSYFVLYIQMIVIIVAETHSCGYCYFDEPSVAFTDSDKFLSGGQNKADLYIRFVKRRPVILLQMQTETSSPQHNRHKYSKSIL